MCKYIITYEIINELIAANSQFIEFPTKFEPMCYFAIVKKEEQEGEEKKYLHNTYATTITEPTEKNRAHQ